MRLLEGNVEKYFKRGKASLWPPKKRSTCGEELCYWHDDVTCCCLSSRSNNGDDDVDGGVAVPGSRYVGAITLVSLHSSGGRKLGGSEEAGRESGRRRPMLKDARLAEREISSLLVLYQRISSSLAARAQRAYETFCCAETPLALDVADQIRLGGRESRLRRQEVWEGRGQRRIKTFNPPCKELTKGS